eukprot:CAMPEP_0185767280 /NCGR_PEP_ID=MMETSP1174-20130828/41862_1 /TAXON_ID=35687 /ORGANISM="Dictyocha speculum, Strain CCMP1381" /LENGTH=64 /DNA_ID=CAMNT_0028451367 /DNA_START=90 /DNA_END=284 /DNA_ORIENTATION=+
MVLPSIQAVSRPFSDVAEAGMVNIEPIDLVDTLEWVLDSPPPIHQFDEPPIVVEIAHLFEDGGH